MITNVSLSIALTLGVTVLKISQKERAENFQQNHVTLSMVSQTGGKQRQKIENFSLFLLLCDLFSPRVTDRRGNTAAGHCVSVSSLISYYYATSNLNLTH